MPHLSLIHVNTGRRQQRITSLVPPPHTKIEPRELPNADNDLCRRAAFGDAGCVEWSRRPPDECRDPRMCGREG
jgi:hypothetical protein